MSMCICIANVIIVYGVGRYVVTFTSSAVVVTGSFSRPSSSSTHQPTITDSEMPKDDCRAQTSRGSNGSQPVEIFLVQPAACEIACQRFVDPCARPLMCMGVMPA